MSAQTPLEERMEERLREHNHALTTRVRACERILMRLQEQGRLDPEYLRVLWLEEALQPEEPSAPPAPTEGEAAARGGGL